MICEAPAESVTRFAALVGANVAAISSNGAGLLGLGAVEAVIGPDHAPEVMGEIIHAMQTLLPPKAEREAALADPVRWSDLIRLARTAAAAVAAGRGMATRDAPPIPPFVAAP